MLETTEDLLAEVLDYQVITNLSLTEKDGFFSSIMTSLTHNVTLQSRLTDLVLLCRGMGGLLPVSVHAAVLCSQSPLLKYILLTVTEPVILLPEVEVSTVWNMLDLLYTGRCVLNKCGHLQLLQLLDCLGLDEVVQRLQVEEPVTNQECDGHTLLRRLSSSGSSQPSPRSPELCCLKCGAKYQPKQSVELFFHERECNMAVETRESLKCDTLSPDHDYSIIVDMPTKTKKSQKISKACYICGTVIAGSGTGWKYPLYSHFSRRHFAEQLTRDFIISDKKCSLCGKEEELRSQLLVHLGATHKMVEKYLDKGKLQKQDYNTPAALKGEYAKKGMNRMKPRKLQLEVTEFDKKLQNETTEIKDLSDSVTVAANMKRKRTANISCPYCEKKFVIRPVLHSHLLSKHFKKDCEEGIKQVLEKTGGECPECPDFSWKKGTLDWSVYIHFSRKHKIAQDLEFSENILNQDNVRKIVERFCPN